MQISKGMWHSSEVVIELGFRFLQNTEALVFRCSKV